MLIDLSAATTELDALAVEWHRWQRINRIVRAILGTLVLFNCSWAVGSIMWRWWSLVSYVNAGLVTVVALGSAYTEGRVRLAFVNFDDKLMSFGRAMDLAQDNVTEFVPEGA